MIGEERSSDSFPEIGKVINIVLDEFVFFILMQLRDKDNFRFYEKPLHMLIYKSFSSVFLIRLNCVGVIPKCDAI